MTKKSNKKTVSQEDLAKSRIDSSIRDIEKKIIDGILSNNPTRYFNIDERVSFGAHKEAYIRKSYHDGLYYLIECINVKRSNDVEPSNEMHVMEWYNLYKFDSNLNSNLTKNEEYKLIYSNSSIDSLLHMIYHPGVDFDVEYQREHVWEINDKLSLIDSIFNNIDIGKFTFARRNLNYNGKLYEIIDGKQRLSTICEFYEDRFKYKGYYFSQLSKIDKNKFTSHHISYATLDNPDLTTIYKTFIKLNVCGKPMDIKHINNVKKLLNKIND